jgi:acyl transferase domain-containing protein
MQTDDRIAIVGIGALLPDALDPASLWCNLLARHTALRPVPDELWDVSHFYGRSSERNERTSSRLGGLLRGFRFSGRDFGIPPSVDIDVDITQKAALVAARAALAEIGIHGPGGGINGAVIIGNGMGGMHSRANGVLTTSHRLVESTCNQLPSFQQLPAAQRERILSELRDSWCTQFQPITSNSLPGALGNIIAARVAHHYNFHGPTFTVDAACASSMAAIECAVTGLIARRYDVALAGGLDFGMDPLSYVTFSRMSALSDVGSFPFDARASGFVMGEGAVLFALKRLQDARRANDHVYALIEGIGSSSDGRGSSIVAPNQKGQRLALKNAYLDAGVSPTQVGYIEAHGTATPIGDPIEILALREAYNGCARGSVALGSIKANVGHLRAAAGGAGLLRAVLALDAGVIPPQAGFETPNPRCKLEASPFRIPTQPQEWPSDKTHAAVSAFGFGGINYHIVLRRSPDQIRSSKPRRRVLPPTARLSARNHGVFAFGAADTAGLLDVATQLAKRLTLSASLSGLLAECAEPQDTAARIAFHAEDAAGALASLTLAIAALRGEASAAQLRAAGIFWHSGPTLKSDAVAMIFPGQGSQYLGMLEQLRAKFPIVGETLQEADEILADHLPQPLSSYFTAAFADANADSRFEALSKTEVLQPAMVVCNEAVRRALLQFCAPAMTFGHSLGEVSACIAAGVMSFEEGLRFAATRGRLLAQAGAESAADGEEGGLLQAAASPATLEQALGGWPDGVTVANRNCLRQTVIGGGAAAVLEVQSQLRAKGIDCTRLPVSQAFHTQRMRSAVAPLRISLDAMALYPPRLHMLSSVSGTRVPRMDSAQEFFADQLSRQVAEPVEFIDTLRNAYAAGARVFLEVGPRHALCGFVNDVLAESEKDAVACCNSKDGESKAFGQALAALVANGVIPGHVPSLQELQGAFVIPRSPRIRTVVPSDAAPAAAYVAPALEPAPAVAARSEQVTGSARGFAQKLNEVVDNPDFWRFFARQAESMMNLAVTSFEAAAPIRSVAPTAAAPAADSPAARSDQATNHTRLMQRVAATVGYPVEELGLDLSLEDELGIDVSRQQEVLLTLARELGRAAPIARAQVGFANLRSLFALLDTLPQAASVAASEPAVAPVARMGVRKLESAAAPRESVAAAAPAPSETSSVADRILSVLMARTGYTRTELQLDAHLEEVLGIDSIAQLEMVAEVQDKLHLPPDDTFRVADYPTLRQLIAHVERQLAKGSAPAAQPQVSPAPAASDVLLKAPYFSRQVQLEPMPAIWHAAARGDLLVLHDACSPKLERELASPSLSFASALSGDALAVALSGRGATLAVLASAPAGLDGSPLNTALQATSQVLAIGRALLGENITARPVVLLVGSESESLSAQAWTGAWVAAWKSLCREWNHAKLDFGCDDLRVLEVQGALDARSDTLITAIAQQGPAEARLTREGNWVTPVLRPIETPPTARPAKPPVAVITGGARGINAVIARTLFELTGCMLVLAGRTVPAPTVTAFELGTERLAAKEALGASASQAAINALVEQRRRSSEAAQTLSALREAGAKVQYITADLAEQGALARVLEAAHSYFGDVDWIIHGAGIERSRALLSKPDSDLAEVLQPKLTGLELAIDTLAPDAKWIAVSSVAARYGNAGQLDYAAANEALARVTLARGGLVLEFGPWRETGMAVAMQHVLKARGIDALAPLEAAREAARLIVSGTKGSVIVSGRMGRSSRTLAGLVTAAELDVPGSEYAASITLHHERLAWLRDHSWRGTGLVPAVVSLSMMIEAAQFLEPGSSVASIHDFTLSTPALVRPAQAQTLCIAAERSTLSETGSNALVVKASVGLAGRTLHSASIRMGVDLDLPADDDSVMPPATRHLQRAELYEHFFHGPSFQVLDSVQICGPRAVGDSVPLAERLGVDLPAHSRLSAMAREVALQTVGAYLIFERSEVALPEHFDLARIYAAPKPGERVRATLTCIPGSGTDSSFDVRITGERARLLECIDGLRFRRASSAAAPAPTALPSVPEETLDVEEASSAG